MIRLSPHTVVVILGTSWEPSGEGADGAWKCQGSAEEGPRNSGNQLALYFECSQKAMQEISLSSYVNFLPDVNFGPFHIAAVYPIMRAAWIVPITYRRTK